MDQIVLQIYLGTVHMLISDFLKDSKLPAASSRFTQDPILYFTKPLGYSQKQNSQDLRFQYAQELQPFAAEKQQLA